MSGNSAVAGGVSAGGAAGSAGGGAIYNRADAVCAAGDNICASGNASVTLKNTILANSTGTGDCAGSTNGPATNSILANYSLITNTSGCTLDGASANNQVNTAANLTAPIAGSGGIDSVIRLSIGSPAFDQGACDSIAIDQRGVPRPQISACDMGAAEYEFGRTLSVGVTGSGAVTATSTALPSSGSIVGCTGSCSAKYANGLVVTLNATTGTGYHGFVWGGDCTSSTTLTMNADKNCTATFSPNLISGNLSGLAGSGLVLHLDYGTGSENLPVTANGLFAFVTAVPQGATYTISVGTQPSNLSQNCQVTQDSTGSMPSGNVTDVLAVCTTNSYTVGGGVSGLTASGLTLQLNGGNDLAVPVNATSFTFVTSLLSGSTYLVSATHQPTGLVCSVTNANGAVTNGNVTNVSVSCVTALSTLTLSIDDAHAYAHYGMTLDYQITLSNSGNTAANGVAVSLGNPGNGVDWANAHCFPGSSAVTCASNLAGGSLGTASVQPQASESWLLTVPVLASAAGATLELDVGAAGATTVKDIDTLVVFRDGFNVGNGDGTQAHVTTGASEVFALPPVHGNAVETIRTLRYGRDEIHVDRVALGVAQLVRLLYRDASGAEHAGEWTTVDAQAMLVIGSVDVDSEHVILLEGTQESLLLQLAKSLN